MYFNGVNPIKIIFKDPFFAKYFYINSGIRVIFLYIFKRKLRLKRYARKTVLDENKANELIKRKIENGTPFMVSRLGSTELNIATDIILKRLNVKPSLNKDMLNKAANQNGLFPKIEETFEQFTNVYLESLKQIDLLGTFRMIMEDYYISKYSNRNIVLSNRSLLDFWLLDEPFTGALVGKKILVIHPFEETIKEQFLNRDLLFPNKNYLPEFELITIKAVQTIAGENDSRFRSWEEALNYMYEKAISTDFDVAIIGAGSYGLPLAAKLKSFGKIAIHMGGVTQMLFGIKGKRWDEDKEASKLYNKHWKRPNSNEIPRKSLQVENGCYW